MPPQLMLITSAGFSLTVAVPLTDNPAAQRIPFIMLES